MTDLHDANHSCAVGRAGDEALLLRPSSARRPPASRQTGSGLSLQGRRLQITQITDGARTFPMPDKFVIAQAGRGHQGLGGGLYAGGQDDHSVQSDGREHRFQAGAHRQRQRPRRLRPRQRRGRPAAGNLVAAGIDPKAVDIVLISHFHGDHVNGLRNADGTARSRTPRSRCRPRNGRSGWRRQHEQGEPLQTKGNSPTRKRFSPGSRKKSRSSNGGKEVAPGITSISTPGHTPGHTSFRIASGSAHLIVQGDVCNNPRRCSCAMRNGKPPSTTIRT